MSNKHEEAIEYVERSKAQNLVELLRKKELLPNAPDETVREYEKALFDYREAEFQHDIAKHQDRRFRKKAEFRLNEVKDKLNSLVERISSYDPVFASIIQVRPMTYSSIKSLIPDNGKTAIIEFFVSEETTIAFIIIPGKKLKDTTLRIDEFTLSDLDDIIDGWQFKYNNYLKKVEDYHKKYAEFDKNRDEKSLSNASLAKNEKLIAQNLWHEKIVDTLKTLYKKLFCCIDKKLNNWGARKIIIVPHRGLHLLPLHSLLNNEEWQRGEYLCDRYEISYKS